MCSGENMFEECMSKNCKLEQKYAGVLWFLFFISLLSFVASIYVLLIVDLSGMVRTYVYVMAVVLCTLVGFLSVLAFRRVYAAAPEPQVFEEVVTT